MVDCGLCKSQHRVGNMPILMLAVLRASHTGSTYPHSRVQSSCNLIILLQPWTATEDLRQPELSHSTLHVSDLSLGRSWCLDPLRWFPSHTTHHIRMSESLWRPLLRLGVQGAWNWLCDARVERGGSTGYDEIAVIAIMIACAGTVVASAWPCKRAVAGQ